MTTLSHPLTYDDLERARALSNDRVELIEGELFVTPAPTPMHQMVSRRLNKAPEQVVEDSGIGFVFYAPLDVHLDAHSVVQPDLLVLLRDRAKLIGDVNVQGPPSLVIEIVSPSTGARDSGDKRDLYARHGVLEFWLVDPHARTLTVYSEPRYGKYQVEAVSSDIAISATISGLTVDLAALFAPVVGVDDLD